MWFRPAKIKFCIQGVNLNYIHVSNPYHFQQKKLETGMLNGEFWILPFLNRLNGCCLSKASCNRMASVLQGSLSLLRELDMSDNDLKDEGVELICAGLRNPNCKLETLKLVQWITNRSDEYYLVQDQKLYLKELYFISYIILAMGSTKLTCTVYGKHEC